MPFSVVEFYGKHSNYACGYCKQSDSCHSHGMWAHKLSCEDYQDLIDRGWRRSGSYCYKPMMDITCCPSYTIKCDVLKFRLNKSHKKIIKRVNKFLRDGKTEPHELSNMEDSETPGEDVDCGHAQTEVLRAPPSKPVELDFLESLVEGSTKTNEPSITSGELHESALDSSTGSTAQCSNESSKTTERGALPKKAKLMRIARKRDKLQQKGIDGEQLERLMQASKGSNLEKSLEDFLAEAPSESEKPAHRLTVTLVRAKDSATPITFKLYSSYQQNIHKDPPSKLSMDRFKRFLINSPLKIVNLPTSGKKMKESLDRTYALYAKYQTSIHNDPPGSIADYRDFLVKSPLKGSQDFGSFHQQYWLDDRLVAVGVIDVLPNCVSSVYFFYDPEFNFLSLGTYGSLRELAYTRARHRQTPSISSYYMGFYIHSCPKMRYKRNLQPSYLLCPEVYSWHLLDTTILAKLDSCKYRRMNEDQAARDAHMISEQDIQDVLLLVGRSYMRYSQYGEAAQKAPYVSEYARLVGRICAKKMMLYGM